MLRGDTIKGGRATRATCGVGVRALAACGVGSGCGLRTCPSWEAPVLASSLPALRMCEEEELFRSQLAQGGRRGWCMSGVCEHAHAASVPISRLGRRAARTIGREAERPNAVPVLAPELLSACAAFGIPDMHCRCAAGPSRFARHQVAAIRGPRHNCHRPAGGLRAEHGYLPSCGGVVHHNA
jgi:hypothetical protein